MPLLPYQPAQRDRGGAERTMSSRPASRSPLSSKQKQQGTKPGVIILTVILVLVAFACGFGALTVQADIAQPLASQGAPVRPFVVNNGDTINTIADNLEHQKFIRNALFLKIYLKVKGKTLTVDPGTYQLSASMTLDQIIAALQKPPAVLQYQFTVPEGERLTQYPDAILTSLKVVGSDGSGNTTPTLPNFSKADFLKAAVQGQSIPDLDLSKYWFVKSWKVPPAYAALEGYLTPSTYDILPTATTGQIITTMLNGLVGLLCPGPSDNLTKYADSEQDCQAHQATITPVAAPSGVQMTVGPAIGAMDALTKYYKGNFQEALTLASLTQREARSPGHFEAVASVYYNRWQETGAETVGTLGADPAEQYYLDSKSNTSKPWGALPASPSSLPNNPYNLYLTKGLPPSAIAGVGKSALYAALDPPKSNYLYFLFEKDCQNHYFTNGAAEQADLGKVAGPNDCS
jgi:UPF0755 protein